MKRKNEFRTEQKQLIISTQPPNKTSLGHELITLQARYIAPAQWKRQLKREKERARAKQQQKHMRQQ